MLDVAHQLLAAPLVIKLLVAVLGLLTALVTYATAKTRNVTTLHKRLAATQQQRHDLFQRRASKIQADESQTQVDLAAAQRSERRSWMLVFVVVVAVVGLALSIIAGANRTTSQTGGPSPNVSSTSPDSASPSTTPVPSPSAPLPPTQTLPFNPPEDPTKLLYTCGTAFIHEGTGTAHVLKAYGAGNINNRGWERFVIVLDGPAPQIAVEPRGATTIEVTLQNTSSMDTYSGLRDQTPQDMQNTNVLLRAHEVSHEAGVVIWRLELSKSPPCFRTFELPGGPSGDTNQAHYRLVIDVQV